jgi:hypothetical protein
MVKTVLGWCWLLATAAGVLPGAATIGGPVAGYVAESPGPVLRAIFGVPGSFRFSDPLPLPDGVTRVHVAPGQDFALVELAGDGVAVLSLSGSAVERMTAVEGAVTPSWVSFSPQAGSAILFSATGSRLQILSGLPDTPRIAMDLDTTALADPPRSAVVSDDGKTVLIASQRAVYLAPRSGSPQLLMTATEIVSLALFRNGTDAAVWDGITGSVYLLRNVSTAPVVRVLASGSKDPGKLYPSWDGTTIFMVRPGAKAVSSIDLASGDIQSFDSAVPALTLDPLRNHDTFLISAAHHGPGWIFCLDGSTGRVVFVPAANRVPENMQ